MAVQISEEKLTLQEETLREESLTVLQEKMDWLEKQGWEVAEKVRIEDGKFVVKMTREMSYDINS